MALKRPDVFKAITPPNIPTHLILVYRCSSCGWVDKIVSTQDEWAEITADESHLTDVLEEETNWAAFDMEFVDDLEDVYCSWGDHPVIEDLIPLMAVCCDDCRKRLSVAR
jgi:hypothetical protein